MIKILALIDTPIWVIITTVLVLVILSQRRRMRGLNRWELWLPRKERRAHARKMLKREQDQYDQEVISRLSRSIYGEEEP